MKTMLLFLFFLFLAIAAGCAGGETAPVDDPGDMIELEITDSIGVEMGDSNYVLGAIEGVAFGSAGEILVLDRSAAGIRVYHPSGEFLTRISRRGTAPGELENPISFAVLGDGRICVCDPWRGGLMTWLPDYSFEGLKVQVTENAPALMQGTSDSGFVAGQVGYSFSGDDIIASVRFVRYDLAPEPSRVYMENSFTFDFMDLTNTLEQSLFWGCFTADRSGNVYFALMEPDDYTITGLREDGTEFMEASREIVEVEKTPWEIADEEAWILAKLEGWDANWGIRDYEPQPFRNQVRQLAVDGSRRLWALRGTSEDPTFDVFDTSSGEFLFTAHIPGVGYEGLFWNFAFGDSLAVGWSDSPELYPQIFVIPLPEPDRSGE